LITLYPDRRTITGNADAGSGGCGRALIRGSCGNVFYHPEEAPMAQDASPDETAPVSAEDPDRLLPKLNTDVAHSARVYDYWLGGKDNFAADREVGDAVIAAIPSTPFLARANRAFLGHAVRYLAEEAGIRQFLDIGTGIPTAGNTHEVAQAAAPGSRVVYVDNDPIVLAHARALMTSDRSAPPRSSRRISASRARFTRIRHCAARWTWISLSRLC
jgi:hypothetical protein